MYVCLKITSKSENELFSMNFEGKCAIKLVHGLGWGAGWGGRGELGSNFAGYVLLASRAQSPYHIIVYSMADNRLLVSHFWANMLFS